MKTCRPKQNALLAVLVVMTGQTAPVRATNTWSLVSPPAQLDLQGDPVSRARAFPKYGEDLIREAREAVQNADYEKSEKILTRYRDAVKELHENLRAHVDNPEKRPNGFKQLQIHLRKSLRDLDNLIASIPVNLHPPFEFLRKEIEKVDRALIEDLFPRRPGREAIKKKP